MYEFHPAAPKLGRASSLKPGLLPSSPSLLPAAPWLAIATRSPSRLVPQPPPRAATTAREAVVLRPFVGPRPGLSNLF